jgi:cellulose synthase operon protein YhjU
MEIAKPQQTLFDTINAAWWFFYFFLTTVLQILEYNVTNILELIALALIVLIPLPRYKIGYMVLNIIRSGIALSLALHLFWNQARLPSPHIISSIIFDPSMRFSSEVILQFIWQHIHITTLLEMSILIIVSLLFSRYYRKPIYYFLITVFIVVTGVYQTTANAANAPITVWVHNFTNTTTNSSQTTEISQENTPKNLDTYSNNFYSTEHNRFLDPLVLTTAANTDIIMLQICSFGWEDLEKIGIDISNFFSQFDIIFTKFTSADSYSHTAAIRLLRGVCGEQKHEDLFLDAPEMCYTQEQWRKNGYRTFSVFNHNGAYARFSDVVQQQGRVDKPFPLKNISPLQTAFDGSPVYDDYEVLSSWLKNGLSVSSSPAAMFYNSITLHAGVHGKNDSTWWKSTNEDQYARRFNVFSTNLKRFFDDLRASNRRAVVVLVAEHGAGLKTTPLQPQMIREIPLPGITFVPAAIKLFGPDFNSRTSSLRYVSNDMISYLGLYSVVYKFLETKPSAISLVNGDALTKNIPTTALVAHSGTGVVMGINGDFYYKKNNGSWEKLPDTIRIPNVNLSFPAP